MAGHMGGQRRQRGAGPASTGHPYLCGLFNVTLGRSNALPIVRYRAEAASRKQGSPPKSGEDAMFARKVTACLNPNSLTEFANLMEYEILPWLRKQEGFLDLIMLAGPDGREITTISFWNHKGSAQAYNSSGYPEVLKILGRLLDGAPYVKTFDVVGSNLQGIAPLRSPEAANLGRETGPTELGYRACETSCGRPIVSPGARG
jgi:hypothetical protein